MFQDIALRQAISLAFDFNWANKNLFYKQYTQNSSFFENSLLKASGLPNAREKQYLTQLQQKYKGDVPTDIFEKPMGWLQQEINIRSRLKLATKILKEAGYRVKNKALFNSKGKKVAFNFLLSGPGFSRIVEPFIKNLRRLGIESKTKILEQSVYLRSLQNRQFDITVLSVGQSQSPGNEQKRFLAFLDCPNTIQPKSLRPYE